MNNKLRILLASISICLFVSVFFMNKTAQAADFVFTRTLQVGSSGEDVRQLQKILNSDMDSRVTSAGPGSPGLETTYFGSLTQAAVVKFQEKYRQDVLLPNGLSAGTGFVGRSTLALLNKSSLANNQKNDAIAFSPPSTTNVLVPPNTTPVALPTTFSTKNPNAKNLDLVLDAIDRVGKKQGLSSDKILRAKQVVISEAATSSDLNKKFIEVLKNSVSTSPMPVESAWAKLIRPLKEAFFPRKTLAAGQSPFGGALLFSMYCTETENWWIGIQPLPPNYVDILTYEEGTQIYLNENIPFTTELLGFYNQGVPCVQGVCPYCEEMPDEGMVSPFVGSSPL